MHKLHHTDRNNISISARFCVAYLLFIGLFIFEPSVYLFLLIYSSIHLFILSCLTWSCLFCFKTFLQFTYMANSFCFKRKMYIWMKLAYRLYFHTFTESHNSCAWCLFVHLPLVRVPVIIASELWCVMLTEWLLTVRRTVLYVNVFAPLGFM